MKITKGGENNKVVSPVTLQGSLQVAVCLCLVTVNIPLLLKLLFYLCQKCERSCCSTCVRNVKESSLCTICRRCIDAHVHLAYPISVFLKVKLAGDSCIVVIVSLLPCLLWSFLSTGLQVHTHLVKSDKEGCGKALEVVFPFHVCPAKILRYHVQVELTATASSGKLSS